MSFRRRTFPEVLDSLLTSVTGGMAAEPHPFPPPGNANPPFRHNLQQTPVADVISVYGSRDDKPYLFRKDSDYKLLGDHQTLEWQKGAALPDPGTLLYVNYYPQSAQPVLTDIETGSVLRTLSESIALELASVYAQLEQVYQAGFIDTAAGGSLDNVVALLGITRVLGGRAAGTIELARAPGSPGAISIPTGTLVSTADGKIDYETTAEVTMAPAQTVARVAARALDVKSDPLPAGSLTLLPVPIAGIAGVTNPAPTARLMQDETDADLRARAKDFLHGSERATPGALKAVLAAEAIAADLDEPPDQPGVVLVTPHAEDMPPDLRQRLTSALNAVRPAGVQVSLRDAVPPRKVNLALRLTTAAGLLEQDLRGIQRAVREKIADYFAKLPAKAAGSINRIVGLVQSVDGVQDVAILSATWKPNGAEVSVLDTAKGELAIGGIATVLGDLQIVDPNLPTQLNAVVTFPKNSPPPDQAAIQTALQNMIAYANGLTEPSLSFGKLLWVTPLPGKPGASLEDYDKAAEPKPALPNETSIAPNKAQFVFTAESGASRILSKASDTPYKLAPQERLAIAGVAVEQEANGG